MKFIARVSQSFVYFIRHRMFEHRSNNYIEGLETRG
jgi:hypothetical protein